MVNLKSYKNHSQEIKDLKIQVEIVDFYEKGLKCNILFPNLAQF